MGPDGAHWRRLVPSPEPREIVQLHSVRILHAAGVTVICAGGGGVPVLRDEQGRLVGVEAVVDKDLSAALLASALSFDGLLMLTDVDAVYEDWDGAQLHPIRLASAAELRARSFAPGSMGPKVEAACRFVEGGGTFSGIGALADALAVVDGQRGTQVRRDARRLQ
jgi:carbamate kinase